mmetsp:Transcript_5618/g.13086  ORF Transcript_5618/g.13086 Transcript_5618/m.13086 type:complete len:475 (-) Transcript_5618:211-1635(-)
MMPWLAEGNPHDVNRERAARQREHAKVAQNYASPTKANQRSPTHAQPPLPATSFQSPGEAAAVKVDPNFVSRHPALYRCFRKVNTNNDGMAEYGALKHELAKFEVEISPRLLYKALDECEMRYGKVVISEFAHRLLDHEDGKKEKAAAPTKLEREIENKKKGVVHAPPPSIPVDHVESGREVEVEYKREVRPANGQGKAVVEQQYKLSSQNRDGDLKDAIDKEEEKGMVFSSKIERRNKGAKVEEAVPPYLEELHSALVLRDRARDGVIGKEDLRRMCNLYISDPFVKDAWPQILAMIGTDAWNKITYDDFLRSLRIAVEGPGAVQPVFTPTPDYGDAQRKQNKRGGEQQQKKEKKKEEKRSVSVAGGEERREYVRAEPYNKREGVHMSVDDVVDDERRDGEEEDRDGGGWNVHLTPKEAFFDGLERRFVASLAREVDRAGIEESIRYLMDRKAVSSFMTRVAEALADVESVLD